MWKPMSEAPTDGTPILVKIKGSWKARVVRHAGKCQKSPPCEAHAAMATPWASGVISFLGIDMGLDVLDEEPEGWMPIPD